MAERLYLHTPVVCLDHDEPAPPVNSKVAAHGSSRDGKVDYRHRTG